MSDWRSDGVSSDQVAAIGHAMHLRPGHGHAAGYAGDAKQGLLGSGRKPQRPGWIETCSRSEESRAGNESVSTCTFRWAPYQSTQHTLKLMSHPPYQLYVLLPSLTPHITLNH